MPLDLAAGSHNLKILSVTPPYFKNRLATSIPFVTVAAPWALDNVYPTSGYAGPDFIVTLVGQFVPEMSHVRLTFTNRARKLIVTDIALNQVNSTTMTFAMDHTELASVQEDVSIALLVKVGDQVRVLPSTEVSVCYFSVIISDIFTCM